MSLSRLPFSISVIWAVRIMLTAPRPPANTAERVGPIGPEVYLMPTVIKTCFFLAGISEILTILAHLAPGTSFSDFVKAWFVWAAPCSEIVVTWPFLISWLCCMVGALIRRQCYRALGESFTFEISMQKDHKLVTSGPYAYVRHPSYSSGALGLFGALTCHTTRGAWLAECSGILQPPWALPLVAFGWVAAAVIFLLAIVPRLAREDSMMRGRFGARWDEWAKTVPYKLVPGIY